MVSSGFSKTVPQLTQHVNQRSVWQPCFPDASLHVLVTLPGQPGSELRLTTSSGDTWKPKCMQTDFALFGSWKSTSRTKLGTKIDICCEQLWAISSHDYRNVLHATETNYETCFFKIKITYQMSFYYWFSIIAVFLTSNTINQNGSLKIATFHWHILYNSYVGLRSRLWVLHVTSS
jgi:hypothetical protein